jgi:hypothetical protein
LFMPQGLEQGIRHVTMRGSSWRFSLFQEPSLPEADSCTVNTNKKPISQFSGRLRAVLCPVELSVMTAKLNVYVVHNGGHTWLLSHYWKAGESVEVWCTVLLLTY